MHGTPPTNAHNSARLYAGWFAAICLLVGPGRPCLAAPAADAIDWRKEQAFWSFQPPRPQPRPAVKHAAWPLQPLDWFVLSPMERAGLAPSPSADRRTLIRRLTFDLTGLPPTPDEVDAFLRDTKPGAYERVVDRLLASNRFGERLASLWLPLVRYAQDQAHQVGDDTAYFYPNAWKYRDWVIAAFNRDLPYDQFVKLQLAADKLPASELKSPDDLAALGLLGLGPKYYDRERLDVMSDEWEDRVDTVSRTFLGLTVSCARCHDHKFDPITSRDYYALAGVFASTKMVNRRPDGQPEKDGVKADKMDPNTLHVVADGQPTDLNVFLRGNVENKGPVVPRRFLRILCDGDPPPFKDGSGRRELAEDIASPANPLAARVIVNRLWALMFGRPIVPTPSNFGHSGIAPTNPELLDDLAVRFVKHGWSIKTLLREMALSATYRQTAAADTAKAKRDGANTLLWRMNRRRLTIEQWRDSTLFVSGELTEDGPHSTNLDDPGNHRRTVYARISRLRLNDILAQFDYPDANVHAEKRSVTTTPTQKLFMLNSPFMLARAKAFAARLTGPSAVTDDGTRIRNAYRLLYSRDPDPAELKLGLAYLARPASGETPRWERYAQALLASDEALYVD
jgi:hypothetical protein